jgi:class 3 adenylate cyclase/predicted ATPase
VDIAAWLRRLGLENYAQAFHANHIDAEVLSRLTAEDLIALGITSVGHRRRLLDAIAALQGEAEASDPVAPAPERTEPAPARARPDAERRQLTIMFVDLVGSTELAARLDPEDMREVIRAYQNTCAEAIARFEGRVAKYMGDGVLAYFGWPQAHEDDAERAVRAGLAIAAAVAGLGTPAGEALQARIGIATGLVLVGDLIGEGAAQEEVVIGETPNLAARLQALAEPGGVVISQATRRLVGARFELADLEPHRVKGFAEPIRAWRVVGIGVAESRLEAMHTAGLTPLVGREHELGLLLDRWERAKEGEGQVVLLSGEPGVGKSRLIRALCERLGDGAYTPLSHNCSPYHRTTALHPVVALLERAAGFARGDPPGRRLVKLEALLGQATNEVEGAAAVLAALLAIPTGERDPLVAMSPQRQKERTLAALLAQLEGLAARQPVLALYEDVHWADPTSLELLDRVVERAHSLPVLVIITCRPEFRLPWTGPAHVTALALGRLDRRHGAALVDRVTGGRALPEEVVEQIVLKTDGVPLFVEELTKAVLESGLLREEGDHYALAGPLPPLAIPSTLQGSLLARLDRLALVKEVAQVGAAIGREFAHDLLAAVAPLREDELRNALEQLIQAELVFRRGTPPQASYTFKHALVRDAAYQTLLKSKRRRLHARIAEVLEERFPETATTEPELLARHCTEAGLAERAVDYWHRAGRQALARSALAEAVAQLNQGLEVLAGLPDGPECWERELGLQTALGGALIAARGYSAPETGRAYERARELCGRLGRPAELFMVLRGLWNCYFVRGELQRARDLAERLVALGAEQGESLRRALAQRALGSTLLFLGEFTAAVEQLDRGIALDEAIEASEDGRAPLLLHAERAGLVCRLYAARGLWFLGFPDRALATVEAGLELGRKLAHPHSLAFALNSAAVVHNYRREFDAARRRAEAAGEVAREHRLPQWLAMATMTGGFALAGLGRRAEGIAQLRTGLAGWNGVGARLDETHWLGLTAAACTAAGQFDEALAALDRAAETAAATRECYYQAELYRLRGTVLAETGEGAEAASWFQQAIDTARSQDAESLELRAATSLARLWAHQGERTQAHDLLAPVYGWFTEGFDTADLKDAKALLDELS